MYELTESRALPSWGRFVRRVRATCFHRWDRWSLVVRELRPEFRLMPNWRSNERYVASWHERQCKRCGKRETKNVKIERIE